MFICRCASVSSVKPAIRGTDSSMPEGLCLCLAFASAHTDLAGAFFFVVVFLKLDTKMGLL